MLLDIIFVLSLSLSNLVSAWPAADMQLSVAILRWYSVTELVHSSWNVLYVQEIWFAHYSALLFLISCLLVDTAFRQCSLFIFFRHSPTVNSVTAFYQQKNHIRGSNVVCSVMHSTVQVLTEDFYKQLRDFSSLSGKVYTYLLIFTQHFHSDTFFHNLHNFMQKSSTRCGAHYT